MNKKDRSSETLASETLAKDTKKNNNDAFATDHMFPYPVEQLEERIGYIFKNKELLTNALTHSSYSNELKGKKMHADDNERLEFLGDSLLSIIVAVFIFNKYKSYNEGDLTRIRASVVCEDSLCVYAKEIGLGDYLLLGNGEVLTHGRHRKSIVADAFEALLAAIYLDGGKEVLEKFVMPFIVRAVEEKVVSGTEDYKSMLQRIVQQTPEERLEYRMEDESGPPHDKRFTFRVYLNSNPLGVGTGKTKRQAEQMAAKESLKMLGEEIN